MRRALTTVREWYWPRQHHSLLDRWWRTFVLAAPLLPLVNPWFGLPWYDGILSVAWTALFLAAGGYFSPIGPSSADGP
jgi:hypothetical protein